MSLIARKLHGGSQAGDIAIEQTDIDASSANFSTYNFNNATIGDAASNRKVVVLVHARDTSGTGEVSSMTVGGISASQVYEDNVADTDYWHASIWVAAVPSGTTANIVINFDEIVNVCSIGVYKLTNETSTTPTATDDDFDSTGTSTTNLAAIAGGQGVGVGQLFKEYSTANISVGGTFTEDGEFLTTDAEHMCCSASFASGGAKSANFSYNGGDKAHGFIAIFE